MGRDVAALRRIASSSGVNVVAATGYYTRPASPPIRDVRAVAREFQQEIDAGIGDTGVRAGVIGEIGTGAWEIGDFERDLYAAAALAHEATGAPIATHSHAGQHAEWQLGQLLSRGVAAARIVIGHVDEGLGAPGHVERLARLAGAGAYLGFDTVGLTYFSEFMQQQLPSDRDRAAAIARLVQLGLAERILVAQDVCRPSHLRSGGGWGYAHVFESFVPLLEEHGVDRTMSARFTGENVVRWLAG
jgi:phosphotriesterase-related protein